MRLRYSILIFVSFVAGCLQGTLDLSLQTTWQLPTVIALAVFLVSLGSYPKKANAQKRMAPQKNTQVNTLFPNSAQFEKILSKDLMSNFGVENIKGPDATTISARKADPSVSKIENDLN